MLVCLSEFNESRNTMRQLNILSKICVGLLMTLLLAVVGIYVFYILHNAEWLIGDDAFMLRRTAFGIPFPLSESILPEVGFFRPFDYLHENFVLLFHPGMHDAFEHYIINAVSFVLCMGALFGILWMTVKPTEVIDYAIVVFGVILVASRLIGIYINIFGPIFGVYTYHMLAVFFLCAFLKNDKVWAMLLSLFCWAYSMMIYENVCLVLGCMGFFPLLFAFKRLNTKQKIYCYTLIALMVAFLVSYLFVIFLPTLGHKHYSPSHGTEVTMLENAVYILYGQKFLWVAALFWLWRQIQIIRKESQFHVLYDTLLWAAAGMVLGGVAIRLNWTMYYYDAIILSLPPVVYFSMRTHEKYGKYITLSIVLFFAVVHSRRVPQYIKSNQGNRVETARQMKYIAGLISNGWKVVWYENGEVEGVLRWNRDSKKEWTQNYIQYLLVDRDWEYDGKICDSTIVLYPCENDKLGDIPVAFCDYKRIPIGGSGVSYFQIRKE